MASLESQLKKYASGELGGSGDLNFQLTSLARKAGYDEDYFRQRDEEERIRKQEEQRKQEAEQATQRKTALDRVGDVGGALWRGATDWTRTVSQGAARALGASEQAPESAVANLERTREVVLQTLRDPSVPQERKDRLLNMLNEDIREDVRRQTETTRTIEEQTDKKRFLGATAEGASMLVGGTGLKSAYKAGGALRAARAVGATAGSGAVGATGARLREDPQASATDLAKTAALGAGLGAGFSVGSAALGKAARSTFPTIAETRLGQKAAQTRVAQKIGSLKDEFVAKIVDDTNFIKKPFKGLTDDTTGRAITDEIEDRVTNVRQFAGLAQQRLDENQAFQELKPLIGGDKKRYQEFGDFIKKKQDAINRNKLIDADKIQGAKATVPTGTPDQEQAYRLLNQATKNDIQYLFDNGIIDEAKYTNWMNDPDYTRVQREVLEDQSTQFGKSGLVSGQSVTGQKLKGSTKEAIDPFTSYEDWQRRVTLEVERNNLARYVRDKALAAGKSNQVQTTDSALEKLQKLYGEEGVKQKTLPVFENGIKELYTIDPRAARQLANSTNLELKAIADWALLPSRLLKGGATSLNAAFAVPNFIRDQMSSAIISKNALATHNPIAFWAGIKEGILKPTGNAVMRKIPGVADEVFEPSPLFKEYLARNANITSVDLARNLKAATRAAQEELGVRGESVLRRYENIISASEKATRYQNFLGTYKNAIKNNIDPEQALQRASAAARTNSINFANRGEIAQFMKIFNPYFNAGVQGSRTLAKAIKERPVPTMMKVGTTVMAPVAFATYHNLSNPEKAEIYANIPDYIKDGNLIMVLGANRPYIKVPLPPGIKEFSKPLRNFIESEYLGDRQGFIETAKNIFIDAFSPVGTTANELVSQALPQAVKPAVELVMNRDMFTGQDIVPENLQGLPKEEQAFESTPQIFKDIAKAIGVSPLQVRQVIRGYGAGGLEGALATFDQARGKESGNRGTVEQILNRFVGNLDKQDTGVTSKFYEAYTPLRSKKEATSRKITDAVKRNDIGTASELARQVNDEIEQEKARLRETYGRFEADLTPLYERLDSLKIPMDGDLLARSSIKSRQR